MRILKIKITRFSILTLSASLIISLIPNTSASGEQIHKTRFVDSNYFNEAYNVGYKAFRYIGNGFNTYYGANIFLPACVKNTDTDCIDSLSYKVNNSEKWLKAELDSSKIFPPTGVPLIGSKKGVYDGSGSFTLVNRFLTPPDPVNNYPAGGTTSYWKAPGASSDSNFRLLANFNLRGTDSNDGRGAIKWNTFSSQITPSNDDFLKISDLKVRLRVNILKQILTGWIHSRMKNPVISYARDPILGEYADISGSPLSVPIAEAQMSSVQYLSLLENPFLKPYLYPGPEKLPPPNATGAVGANSGVENGELKLWSAFQPFISDVAFENKIMWKFVSTGILNLKQFNTPTCNSEGKIDGILATNATQYSPTPPTYIESSQELSYQLAAPHLKTPTEEFKGSYSLVLSEKLAICIWGKDLNNSSASISILNNEGKSSVVTQTLKLYSGFYYFNLDGFGFSAPTIRIKLTQDLKAPVDKAANTLTPKVAEAKKPKTITCLKGKLTKKITAVSPKCPAGYKKR